jgi:hypothetical protein
MMTITIATADFTATQKAGEPVQYADHFTPEQAVAHVTANLENVPAQVCPIVEWAMTEACRKVLLKKGGIGEEWFTAVPVASKEARKELSPFGSVDKFGYFYFDYTAKYTALEWIKARADKREPNFTKRNGHHYAVDLGDLGMVIVEKPKRASNLKPWLVRYRLPTNGPAQPYFLENHNIPKDAFGGEK